jgi:hypothetical protein
MRHPPHDAIREIDEGKTIREAEVLTGALATPQVVSTKSEVGGAVRAWGASNRKIILRIGPLGNFYCVKADVLISDTDRREPDPSPRLT